MSEPAPESALLARPAPRWVTIGAHRPFLQDLASGLWRELGGRPEGLAEATVLLPTRRAGRELAQAFVGVASTTAVLLPQIRALGDLDEDEAPFVAADVGLDLPPAIGAARRRYELAGLAARHQGLLRRTLDAGAALELADALGRFLDACQLEERVDRTAVAGLAQGEFARHWQISAEFLDLALGEWPNRLAELGMMDAAQRRVALMRGLAERWRRDPPDFPVIAAGSTGSAPAAADLLSVIAAAPQGLVVLPGLDKSLAEDAWEEVGDGHPQDAMKRLLSRAGVTRGEVRLFDTASDAPGAGRWRRSLINEALRPPQRTADWRKVIEDLKADGKKSGRDALAEGLDGLTLTRVRDEDEAASLAAVLMREALETPDRTCALVTPDAALAQRVSARLTRWGIGADVSAGEPLAGFPNAVLAGLLARATARPLDPVILLAILKHPLTRLGLEPAALATGRRRLERHGLRGLRPQDWETLLGRLDDAKDRDGQARELARRLQAALATAQAPFAQGMPSAAEAATALTQALEMLAADAEGATGALWAGRAGEALGQTLSALIEESEALPGPTAHGFADLLRGALEGEVLRRSGVSHPRLRIMGVLEARLVRSDLTILAGLEEGSWPAAGGSDPFLSRPMRAELGLPSPERRIGLSAHDFAQAACAPQVAMIECERRDGSPAVASRWLWRLRTLALGAQVEIPARNDALAWARALDAPIVRPPPELRPAPRPGPAPPVAFRPRKMGVTTVERWLRDPYAIYARYILRLRPLALPDEPLEAMLRGSAVHKAFEAFAQAWPEDLPEGAERRFVETLMESLSGEGMPKARLVRERALAENLAPWVIALERDRRPGARLQVETSGVLTFDAPGGPFTLTAKADRLEMREGVADILDFKTGSPPSLSQVREHLAPQLTLTAAILAAGGFAEVGCLDPGELVYVRVSGGRIPGRVEERSRGAAAAMAVEAIEGLKRLVAHFDRDTTPYKSWTRPQFIGSGGDYDHLARVWEWRVIGEGAGDDSADSGAAS